MKSVAEAINRIGMTSGRLDKENLLRVYANMPGFKDTLKFIFDPYIHTGISDSKMQSSRHSIVHDDKGLFTLQHTLTYFTEHQTGDSTNTAFAWFFINDKETEVERGLAYAIVTKTLKIGVTATTLNNVYGKDFIPIVGCNLGVDYDKRRGKMHGDYIASRKIDGVRRLMVKEGGAVTFFSRSGHADSGLVSIVEESVHLPDGFVYDGELEAIGDFKSNIARRQATASLANRKGIKSGLRFNVFDVIPVDEFRAGQSKDKAIVRKNRLREIFAVQDLQFICAIPTLCVSSNIKDHEAIFCDLIARGEEGIMLVQADSLYRVGKRTNDWVKMKGFYVITLPVIDVLEGSGKNVGKLGSARVMYNNAPVDVGSGFSDFQRSNFWEFPEHIVGSNIIIECQGESMDSTTGVKSLNCPIFKGFASEDMLVGKLVRLEV